MATIGSLAVKLAVNPAGFVSGLNAAGKMVGKFVRRFTGQFSSITKVVTDTRAAIAGLAGYGIASWIRSAAQAAIETTRFARSIGASTEGIAALQRGIRQLGGDSSTVQRGLLTLAQTIAEATSGNLTAANPFQQLGLDLKDLAAIPVDRAFVKVAQSLASITDPTKRAALATQIFGRDASALLPLLSQGEAGLAKFAEEAKRLGLSFDAVQGAGIESAAIAFENLKDHITGVATQIAVNLSPWILSLSDNLADVGVTTGSVADMIVQGFRWIAKGVGFAVDVWYNMRAAVDLAVIALVNGVGYAAKAIKYLVGVAALLPDSLGGDMFREAEKALEGFANDTIAVADDLADQLARDLARPSAWSQVDKAFDGIAKSADKAAKAANGVRGAMGAVAAANVNQKLFEDASKVFEEVINPLERFQSEVARLDKMLAAGAISWDVYAQAVGGALKKLEDANGLNDINLPAGLRQGTTEARSAVVRAQRAADIRTRETPQDRLKRVLDQSKEIYQKQLEKLQEIARAVKAQPVPVAM